MTYQLPNGERVEIYDDVARGASVVSYTLKGGRVVDAIRTIQASSDALKAVKSQPGGHMTNADTALLHAIHLATTTDLDTAMRNALAASEELKADIDQLEVRVKELLAERAHIIAVLTTFYRGDISMSSLQPVLDLAREINPALNKWTVRS